MKPIRASNAVAVMEYAAARSIFPQLRARPSDAAFFAQLCISYSVPINHVMSLGNIGNSWYECDSAVDLRKWRCVFSEIEYSPVDPALMATALEDLGEAYEHPTLFPMTVNDPRALAVVIPVANTAFSSEEEMLGQLSSKYRYVVRKACAQPFKVQLKTVLSHEEIEWALGNIGERFYNDHMTFVMATFLWSVARRNVQVVLRDQMGNLQAIAGFQDIPEQKSLRFGAFVSAHNAMSHVGVRALWEACKHAREVGYTQMDPTARCTLFDAEDPNYVYKHKVCSTDTVVYTMGSVVGETVFAPPFYRVDEKKWVLQETN